LAAVFTELNPKSRQFERFVYVKAAEGVERRIVQIGVSDYFFAEVQNGLAAGDIVVLQAPDEKEVKVSSPPARDGGQGGGPRERSSGGGGGPRERGTGGGGPR
jgi:hypothetical protein